MDKLRHILSEFIIIPVTMRTIYFRVEVQIPIINQCCNQWLEYLLVIWVYICIYELNVGQINLTIFHNLTILL